MTKLEILPVAGKRTYPPRVTRFTQTFWQGLRDGILQTTRCKSCERLTFPPKPICPHCWGDAVSWETLPVEGTLYSWTRIHAGPAIFEAELPYEVGIVDLDAGLRLACRLNAKIAADWRCGMRVKIVTLDYEDGPLFAASPA